MRARRARTRADRGRRAPAAALLALAVWTAGAPAAQIADRVKRCAECHGPGGNSATPGIPSLAAQPENFLSTQLILFRERLRRSEQMTPEAQGLADATVLALAEHYAKQVPEAPDAPADPQLVERGRDLAGRMRCGTCHLPDYSGREQIPRLAGQREEYLAAAMRAYRANERGAADTAMNDILYGISDAEIRALAHFLSQQPPRARVQSRS